MVEVLRALFLRQDDDARARQVAEEHLAAVLGDGQRDVLAAALQRGLADQAEVLARGGPALDDALRLRCVDVAGLHAQVHRVAAAAEALVLDAPAPLAPAA